MTRRRSGAAPRSAKLLAVDPLGTPVEFCWLAAGHDGPCPYPTRGNALARMPAEVRERCAPQRVGLAAEVAALIAATERTGPGVTPVVERVIDDVKRPPLLVTDPAEVEARLAAMFELARERDRRRFANNPDRCQDCRWIESCRCGTRWVMLVADEPWED